MFADLQNPYGTAAFETVAYPMPDLHNKQLVRKVKRSLARGPRRQPHEIVKNFLLTF